MGQPGCNTVTPKCTHDPVKLCAERWKEKKELMERQFLNEKFGFHYHLKR